MLLASKTDCAALVRQHQLMRFCRLQASVLFGDVAPSGRLPMTWPFNNYTTQIKASNMGLREFPGRTHRYITVPVLFKFGYGLSTTEWAHTITTRSPPEVSGAAELIKSVQPATAVAVTAANIGQVSSAHVVLLFGTPPPTDSAGAMPAVPQRVLIGFERLPVVKSGAVATLLIDPVARLSLSDHQV